MVAVFDQVARRIAAARSEVNREHRLDIGEAAPVDEFVGAERIRLGRHPREVEAAWPFFGWADAVLPVIAGHEVAARIAHHRHAHSLHFGNDVRTESVGIRAR